MPWYKVTLPDDDFAGANSLQEAFVVLRLAAQSELSSNIRRKSPGSDSSRADGPAPSRRTQGAEAIILGSDVGNRLKARECALQSIAGAGSDSH